MTQNAFTYWLVLIFVYGFVFTASGQNYYPAAIGNTWVLKSTDGESLRTYTVAATEVIDGVELTILEIASDGADKEAVEIDKYFVTVTEDKLLLHQTVFDEGKLGIVTAKFSPPATFFPQLLTIGDAWQIAAEIKLTEILPGREIAATSTTDVKVILFEDVETPAGTFKRCVKVALSQRVKSSVLNLEATSYQWLAPNLGPVKYETADGLVFELIRSNLVKEEVEELSPYDVNGDGAVNILDLTLVASQFGGVDVDADVNDDGTVNIQDLVMVAQNFGD